MRAVRAEPVGRRRVSPTSGPTRLRALCHHAAMADTGAVWSRDGLLELHAGEGRPYAELLRVEALSAGIYKLAAGATDPQTPHREDEVYVVVAGAGAVEIAEKRNAVSAGTVVYVPRGVQHRFVDITEDLEVLVIFAPPESRGSETENP